MKLRILSLLVALVAINVAFASLSFMWAAGAVGAFYIAFGGTV